VQEQRPLTEHEKAVVEAIVAALKPLLAEIERRLDAIDQKLDAIAVRQWQARPRPRPATGPCADAQPCRPRDRSCRESRP
jgi:hypothetical protein